MNETDLSNLSYKELQALAVRCRVPGNIKKHQLVRVLQAVQSGNVTEVDRILAELQQTRKKRMKKVKRDKMNVISTPIHSPNYAMSEDYYYSQQHPPYQWVGAEEEISSREEDPARFPNYDEFQQFLLHRIQREYRSYAMPDSELVQIPSVVDLRMGAGSSIVRQLPMDVNRAKANIVMNPNNGYDQALLNEGELQITEDTNGNNQVPILLKKMLEAPAGANLGQIASPDTASYQISSLEQQRPNNSSDPMDDSDTLTAESDGDNDDLWEYNNTENNNNNNNRSYYFIVNNVKDPQNMNNQSQIPEKSMQEIGQLPCNFLSNSAANNYLNSGGSSEIQANCQKWIAGNSFASKETNYAENLTDNSRSYTHNNSVYYENSCVGNSRAINKSRNPDQHYANNGVNDSLNYETNHQSSLHGQHANETYQYYQINNETAETSVNPNDAYYFQQMMAKRCVSDPTQKYFAQGSSSSNNLHSSAISNDAVTANSAAQAAPQTQFHNVNPSSYNRETGALFNSSESNAVQYNNVGYYSTQYSNEDNQSLANFSTNTDQPHYPYQQQLQIQQYQQQGQNYQQQYHPQQQTSIPAGPEIGERKNFTETVATSQSITTNGTLDSFWPRWPINSTVTSSGQLEPILNLRNYNCFDYTKMDQTSCVYCYTAPVVTQRIESSKSSCTEKKRLWTECRQHTFRPNQLIYNDAATGMRMANIREFEKNSGLDAQIVNCPGEILNDAGPSTSSMDLDSENLASTESSDNSINDVWIHDYTRYPSSSDYAPQSNGLIIDENENDLFSL